jgi:hypothetical protein
MEMQALGADRAQRIGEHGQVGGKREVQREALSLPGP